MGELSTVTVDAGGVLRLFAGFVRLRRISQTRIVVEYVEQSWLFDADSGDVVAIAEQQRQAIV